MLIFVSRSVLMWKTNLDLNFAFLVNICSSCNYSVLHCLYLYVVFSMTNPLTDCLFMLVYCYWKTSILDVSIVKFITPVFKYTMTCLFKKVRSRICSIKRDDSIHYVFAGSYLGTLEYSTKEDNKIILCHER